MLIVAVAWLYVTILMAFTEPTVVAGIMTFLLYCVLPLGILFYLTGSKGRKRRRAAEDEARRAAAAAAPAPTAPPEQPTPPAPPAP